MNDSVRGGQTQDSGRKPQDQEGTQDLPADLREQVENGNITLEEARRRAGLPPMPKTEHKPQG